MKGPQFLQIEKCPFQRLLFAVQSPDVQFMLGSVIQSITEHDQHKILTHLTSLSKVYSEVFLSFDFQSHLINHHCLPLQTEAVLWQLANFGGGRPLYQTVFYSGQLFYSDELLPSSKNHPPMRTVQLLQKLKIKFKH